MEIITFTETLVEKMRRMWLGREVVVAGLPPLIQVYKICLLRFFIISLSLQCVLPYFLIKHIYCLEVCIL